MTLCTCSIFSLSWTPLFSVYSHCTLVGHLLHPRFSDDLFPIGNLWCPKCWLCPYITSAPRKCSRLFPCCVYKMYSTNQKFVQKSLFHLVCHGHIVVQLSFHSGHWSVLLNDRLWVSRSPSHCCQMVCLFYNFWFIYSSHYYLCSWLKIWRMLITHRTHAWLRQTGNSNVTYSFAVWIFEICLATVF